MTEQAIPVSGSGQSLRSFEQTTTAGVVQTEAVAIVDATDVTQKAQVINSAPAANASGVVVRLVGNVNLGSAVEINSASLTKNTVTLSASGDTDIRVPAAGKKIRLYFFGYSAGANVTGVLVGLKLQGYNSSAVFDQQYLIAAGQPYARNLEAGDRYIEGSVDGKLIGNLSAAQTVYLNYEIEEI